MTEADMINEFELADAPKRISIIFYNLSTFEGIMSNYRENLIEETWEQIQCNRRGTKGDLGVRVQENGLSDPTFKQAITLVTIEEMVDTGIVPDMILNLVDDQEETSYQVKNYHRMRKGYGYVARYVNKNLGCAERQLVTEYIVRDASIADIAENMGVEIATIRQRLYRICVKMQADLNAKFGRLS